MNIRSSTISLISDNCAIAKTTLTNMQYNTLEKLEMKTCITRKIRKAYCFFESNKKTFGEFIPLTGQRQHSLSILGVSQDRQTHEVKSRTCLAP